MDGCPILRSPQCLVACLQYLEHEIDGLVQERRNSIANALELCLSCTNQIEMLAEYDCI